MAMKRLLGPALLVLLARLLAGCGDSPSDAAEDPASRRRPAHRQPRPRPTADAEDGPTLQEIALVSQTAAGGNVDPAAVPLDDHAARQLFLRSSSGRPRRQDRQGDRGRDGARGLPLIGAVVRSAATYLPASRWTPARRLADHAAEGREARCRSASRRSPRSRSSPYPPDLGLPHQEVEGEALAHGPHRTSWAGTVWTPMRPGTTKPTRRPSGLQATPMPNCPEQEQDPS